MMSALYKKLKNKINDNRGSALVLVVIAIAFVGTLVAMLIYLVYFNYLMKFTDRSAKANFYTAESALEVLKAGLEKDVSEAMVVSYYDVMSNHTSDSALNKQAAFEEAFRDELESAGVFHIVPYSLGMPVQTMNTYDPSVLESYWTEVQNTNAGYSGFKVAAAEGDEGAWLETYAWDRTNKVIDTAVATDPEIFRNEGPVVLYNGSIMEFKNIRVKYIDDDGYVSIIETDIQIETPKINFSNVLSVPRIEEYSLIAAGGIYNGYERREDVAQNAFVPTPVAAGANTKISGNVNGGEDGIFVNGVDNRIVFAQNDEDVIANPSKIYTITADTVNALSGRRQADVSNGRPASLASIDVDDSYEIWANDLYAQSATLKIAANCFVQDDLTTDGSYPAVYLSGTSYSGYGTADTTAKGNSSILINGAHTTLDMSSLQKLELAGHAYVGTLHYYAELDDPETGDYIEDVDDFWKQKEEEEKEEGETDTGDDGVEETHPDGTPLTDPNEKEILMGQSVAVKADQLMYMVPVECMGYDGDTQILAKNPMTYTEYLKFATTYEPEYNSDGTVKMDGNKIVYSDKLKYDVVRLDVVMNKVGSSINSYGADYVPVFRRVNGDILVYFYIKFTTDDKANQFFRDYYRNDQDAFANYFDSYVDTYRINSSITADGSSMLNLAGNMLYKRNGRIYLKEDTYEEDLDIYDSLYNTRQQNALYFQNLTKYLMKSTDDLSAAKLKNDVFTNIVVEEDDFEKQVPEGKFSKYKNPDGKVVALVINNAKAEVFDVSASNAVLGMTADELKDLHLIIASGDVKISIKDYDGLIFSGGDIYIGSNNKTIDYSYAQVPLAMTAVSEDGQYVFEVIQNGIAYANTIGTTDDDLRAAIEAQSENDIVRASELVRFVNWNKE